ncbi:S41 family peptidase [Spirosoma fluviale]|uniref:C-terminal processing protease CtpA/Prc, contains a PDZ domain n=1 Tax=Spirosoma fluviale TaxID=1597977 RepID=A0A286GLP2_9BACT|nr:S41 family peptidase [Spirosoma fluviale]SOD96463.1 C-terminal processing protease CtpA/Prc, contains a PDZ domain [Spirosoma fluviale]
MKVFHVWRPALLLAVSATVLLTGCKKNEDVSPGNLSSTTVATGVVTDTEVNEWILQNMQSYYFWNDKLPASPNKSLSPDKFFASLLNTYNATSNTDGDRFSWIQPSAETLKASLSGQSKTTGLQYKLYYRDNTRTTVIASVLYVLPGSPAAKAGIKRGDIISKVNGQTLTGTNYSELLSGSSDTYTYGFATVAANGSTVDTDQTKQVTAIVFQEDPVLLDSIYTINGKTIGYVVYNQFIPGTYTSDGTTDKTYDLKLDNIFGKFKQKGVNELVLDLRYNRGGYVSSAVNLASSIGKNVDASKVFYSQKWNPAASAAYAAKYGSNWNIQNFVNKSTSIGSNLSRVFVLTTSSTASASELIINGLRPFMTVTTIGTTTVGKNVGSITISDATGRIKWGMQPITFKSANAQGFTEYGNGFVPSVEVKEPTVAMKPFGDLSESMLSEAVFQIAGVRNARRVATLEIDRPFIGSSLDEKAGGGNMYISDKQLMPAH